MLTERKQTAVSEEDEQSGKTKSSTEGRTCQEEGDRGDFITHPVGSPSVGLTEKTFFLAFFFIRLLITMCL